MAAEVPSLLAEGPAETKPAKRCFGYARYLATGATLNCKTTTSLSWTLSTQRWWIGRDELSIPLVLTNDSHYVTQGDSIAHDLMLCVQTTSQLSDPKRMRLDKRLVLPSRPEDEMRTLCRKTATARGD
ncbi:MAG: hypothetical protein V9F04_16565 [Dermatophilaceae bacterium]